MPSPPKIDWVKKLDELPDKGNEFARFVRDLVRKEYPDAQCYQYKDGGVDIYSVSQGVIWQCKFVGLNAKGDRLKLATERINKTFSDVAKYFTGRTTSPNPAPYDIWCEASIKKYIYCVSVELSAASQKTLQRTVLGRFQNLANHDGLSHLRQIDISKIEVWTVGRIDPKLECQPDVQLTWFGLTFPSGVQTLSEWKKWKTNDGQNKSPNERNFHSYLFAPTLPYTALQNAENSPAALLKRLESQESKTLVIHGAGGRGKTRLALEIGLVATHDGWIVLMLKVEAAQPSVIEELAQLVQGAKTLLIIDYAERTESFVGLHTAVQTLNETANAQLHLVATSRSKKTQGIEYIDAEFLYLEPSASHDTNLIKEILGDNLEEFAPFCKGIPVFAAFVRLLNDRKQRTNLDALRKSTDFGRWLLEHVQYLPAGKDALALAELLCAMPSTDVVVDSLSTVPHIESYKNQLHKDGWLVYSPSSAAENWSCAHDLIADGAIIDALSEPTMRDSEAATLLRVALKHSSHISTLRALARVANDASIGRVAWRALFAKDPPAWLPHSGVIAHSGLIQSSELIEWLETIGKSRTELAADALVGSALVSALRDSDLTLPEVRKAWDPWIVATFSNVSNVVESSRLLATWLGVTHSVEVFRDQVVAWLASHGDTRPAGRVYVAWLRAKGAKDVAKSLFDQWLHKHNNETFAYLSIRAWLDTDGDTDVALDAVIRWLASKLRSESLEARFLYRAWLRAGGDPEVVRAKIVGWLALHAEAPESKEVASPN